MPQRGPAHPECRSDETGMQRKRRQRCQEGTDSPMPDAESAPAVIGRIKGSDGERVRGDLTRYELDYLERSPEQGVLSRHPVGMIIRSIYLTYNMFYTTSSQR